MARANVAEEVGTGEKILAVAAALFFEKGYDLVSIREITEAASVNVAAVNYHFGGKKNLYRQVMRKRLGEIAREKLAALDGVIKDQGFDDLRAIIKGYVADLLGSMLRSREEERFVELISREIAQGSVATDLLFEELIYPIHTLLKNAITKARPDMSPQKASLCISSITGQILHFARARIVVGRVTGRKYDEKFLEELVDHITDFSIRGLEE